jgi:hypothetical protein
MTDIENVHIKAPLVISIVCGILVAGLGYWVQANDSEIEKAQDTALKNADQISEIAKQQAVTQTQVSQILNAVQSAQQDAKETHDAVIRLEAQQQVRAR